MEKMNFNLLRISGAVKVKAMAFAIMFMMGMGTLSAQYVGTNQALRLIKGEVEVLLDQQSNTTNTGELSTIRFKSDYYFTLMQNIEDGLPIPEALNADLPLGKSVQTDDYESITAGPDFKAELAALISEATTLLSE